MNVAPAWHEQAPADACAALQSRPTGLAQGDAAARLARDGRNVLPTPPVPGWLRIGLRQLRSPLVYVLLVAAGGSLLLGHLSDAGFIGFVLLVNRWPGARDRLAGLVVLIPLIPAVAAWAVVPARALTGVVNGRDLAWIPALEAFTRSPVTGYGPEVLSRAYWRTQPNQWWEPLHAHNQALQTLAESGLIGAAALVALILTAVVATFARSGTMASLLVALLGFLAFQSTVEVPLGLTYFPISYLLPALCLAVFAYTGDLGRATRPVRER